MNKWSFQKGDTVVMWATVRHVREDGSVDLQIDKNKFIFGANPQTLALAVDPEEGDWDGCD